MKKYIVLFLVLIFICGTSLTTVAKEPELVIYTEKIVASSGETVTVKFSFENNPGISLFTLGIDFDESKFTLKEINGNALMGGSFSCNVDERFVLWISSSGDSTFEGTVFTAVFEVKETAGSGQSAVTVSLPNQDDNILNNDGENIEAQIFSGYIDIQKSLYYGDVNGDKSVNIMDLVDLRTILLNSQTIDDSIRNVCNLNADNAVDARDLVHLKKYLAGVL